MKHKLTDFSLAILSGGRSSRLGTDKGLFKPLGDESLVVRAINLLASPFSEILLVVKDAEQAELYRLEIERHCDLELISKIKIVTDEEASVCHISATLVGVFTALKFSKSPKTITIPVDQLGVRAVHLRALVAEARSEDRCGAFKLNSDDDAAPFPSWWSKELLEKLEWLLNLGSFSIKNALSEFGGKLVLSGDFFEELSINANTSADYHNYFGSPLVDGFSRRMHYLRFSLTESCNMSCQYCLPEGFPEWYRHKARLKRNDISTILKSFRRLGFRKARFTGGEPTLHPDCMAAVVEARKIGFEQISLTTNGLLIDDLTQWHDAGLTSLNISLDSLRPEIFEKITKSKNLKKVLNLIERAIELNIETKINTVLMRSLNGTAPQIEELIDWAVARPLTLRFIELMPTKLNDCFQDNEKVLGHDIEPLLLQRGLTNVQKPHESRGKNSRGPATVYSSPLYRGQIGLINPLSCNFCNACNRLRVTAKAGLKLCLFGDEDTPLNLSSEAALENQMRLLIGKKKERHYLEERNLGNVSTFRNIGG